MADCVIGMRSQFSAEKARRCAVMEKISAEVVSVDPSVTKRGCSIGIRINCSEIDKFLNILDKKKIPYGDIIGRGGRLG
ncbi:MAG: DUF3343 domain-containing protein [Ruminococcaceae bacterium]|nr:DUF3343 domain-containing protein [Oscillospiraceae bacterium]